MARVRGARPRREWAIACGLGAAALMVGQALALAAVVARVFVDRDSLGDVAPLLALAGVAVIARSALLWAGEICAQSTAADVKLRLRGELLLQIRRLGLAFRDTHKAGEVATHSRTRSGRHRTVRPRLRAATRVGSAGPGLVFCVVLAFDPLSALVLAVTGPLLVVFLGIIGSRTRRLADERFVAMARMAAVFVDMLEGLPTLKLFGRSKEQLQSIRESSAEYGRSTMLVLRTAFETSLVLELSATVAVALVAVG